MRHIRLEDIEQAIRDSDPGWFNRAEQALTEVQALPSEDRPKAINDRSALWSDLKTALREVSHRKCWYCESREDRSDNAVDHYRPKNRVAECMDHEGYWW